MREVETLLILKTLVVAAIDGGILETIPSGCEVVGDDTLLYDVCDIIHVINGDVTLVLWIDPVELFQGMDGYSIACCILACEATVCILDKNGALDMLLEDGLIDGFWLRACGFIEDDYLGIGDAIDAELEQESLGEGVLLVEVAQDGDVDVVELGKVEALEGSDAMHDTILGNEEDARDANSILGLVGSNWHDERALAAQ